MANDVSRRQFARGLSPHGVAAADKLALACCANVDRMLATAAEIR